MWGLIRAALIALLVITAPSAACAQNDPLPSWNDGAAKTAIMAFVARVTTAGGSDYVAPEARIATFDNDGTLWCEQPVYFQVAFALDRLKAMAAQHPEWKTRKSFKAVKTVLEKDRKNGAESDPKALDASDEKALLDVVTATHAGMSTEAFAQSVLDWIATARHPRFKRPYTDLVYAPMVELLSFLRRNGFKTYIVSGGGVEFMRPWTERVYGIPPEQVIGSAIHVQYQVRDGRPVLVRLPEIAFIDDRAGKPAGIQRAIGRRPIAAFGNSDGDYEMLRWTTAGPGPRLGLIVHHTDAAREWAYDRESSVGRLARALDDAPRYGWIIADMKDDWKVIYPFQK